MQEKIRRELLRRWRPAPGATLDLDFIANRGYAHGQGIGRIRDLVTISGGAGGTVVGPTGLIVSASAPRFDYDPVSLACKGLLVEEQSTNNFVYSAALDNAAWFKSNLTPAGDAGLAPDGTMAMELMTENTATSLFYTRQIIAGTSNVAWTVAGFFKQGTGNRQAVLWFGAVTGTPAPNSANRGQARWDLATGALATAVASGNLSVVGSTITALPNGVYYCTFSVIPDTTGASGNIAAGTSLSDGTTIALNRTGDGVSSQFHWGLQLEQASIASSYIPTGAAAVTRTAHSAASLNVAELWAPGSTLAVEFRTGPVSGTRPILSLDDNTANQQIRLYTSGTDLKLTVADSGVTQADLTLGTVAANTTYKAAIALSTNDIAAVMTGGTVQTDSACTIPAVDRIRYGSDQASNYGNNWQRRARVFKGRRLSNGELQGLV